MIIDVTTTQGAERTSGASGMGNICSGKWRCQINGMFQRARTTKGIGQRVKPTRKISSLHIYVQWLTSVAEPP